jgi:hypothetical protein
VICSQWFLKTAPFVILVASGNADAVIKPTRCNSCSEAQYQATAYSDAVARHQAGGYTFVYDKIYGQLRKFAVEREPAGGGTYNYNVYSVPADQSEIGAWTNAKSALAANGGSSNFFGVVNQNASGFPVSGAKTVDVVWTSAYRNQISNWLIGTNNNIYVVSGILTFAAVINAAAQIILQQDIFSTTITIVMNDGGQLKFQWTAGQSSATLISAMDADMNDIPMQLGDVPGQYIFSHDDGPVFVNYIDDRWGIKVNVCLNGTLACSGDGHQNYSCTWVHCGGVP